MVRKKMGRLKISQEQTTFFIESLQVQDTMIKAAKIVIHSCALMAHVYNPSYSGGGDEEDGSLKPARANSS
jgi:hypothetical protein